LAIRRDLENFEGSSVGIERVQRAEAV